MSKLKRDIQLKVYFELETAEAETLRSELDRVSRLVGLDRERKLFLDKLIGLIDETLEKAEVQKERS